MSVLIKGMEMPTTCFECPFMFARRYCCADSTLDLYQGDYEELKGRVDGCPLIPVPDHGDLIDRDALKNKHHWTDDFYETEYVEVEDIDAAPVIIPADNNADD